jgi:hypothetical protein
MVNRLPRILGLAIVMGTVFSLSVPFNTRADDEGDKVYLGCVHTQSECEHKAHEAGYKYHAATPDRSQCNDHLACFGWR